MEAVEQTYALATLPLVQDMADTYSFGTDLVRFENTLIKTVFPADKQVTNSQFLMFLGVAKAYRLNPFIREIFAFPNPDGSIVPIVSVDGWISLANRQADYDGVEFEYEWAEGKVGGNLLSCTAIIFRKDRSRPTKITELMSECFRDTKQWKQKPMRMIRHKAFIQGLRYAYGFGGIYDEDEGERILEGTLKPTANGNFQSEIAMPHRVQQIAAPAAEVSPKEIVGTVVEAAIVREGEQTEHEPVQAEPAEQATVQNLDSLKGLFDSGQIQQGTGNIANVIGKGRAQRLYAILNKHKIHTEKELKLEFLAPRGIEHVPEMPLDIYERVCAWAEGKLEDQG